MKNNKLCFYLHSNYVKDFLRSNTHITREEKKYHHVFAHSSQAKIIT